MLFDDERRAMVCRVLVRLVDLRDLWSADGPTDTAELLRETDGAGLTAAARALLLISWGVWNGAGNVDVADLEALGPGHLRALGSLLVAAGTGPEAVDLWLELYDPAPHTITR